MKFTKPSIADENTDVFVFLTDGTVEVKGCNQHTLNEAIKEALKSDGWVVHENKNDGYKVVGFTLEDRRVLRSELVTAYLESPNTKDEDDRILINDIVKILVTVECRDRDDIPHFPQNFDAIKASQYDNSLLCMITAAKEILALMQKRLGLEGVAIEK